MNNYILSDPLRRAVEVALYLDKPLLLCGEPGTGKTTLAKYLSALYSKQPPGNFAPFNSEPLVFNTKTTSVATDLFYNYDALSRLRDAYAKTDKSPGTYIELKALGKAIVFKHGANSPVLDAIRTVRDFMIPDKIPQNSTSSVVLIDEIDKAPRDFPNDILNEIEKQEFDIRELNAVVPSANNNGKIFVIMTSNNEKNLPDAFLRRCVFHYIEFPDDNQLTKIVGEHFESLDTNGSTQVMGVIKTFNELRNLPIWKKPATAEFIDWLHILERENLLLEAQQSYVTMPPKIREQLINSLGLLFKNNNDISQVKEAIKNL